MEQEINARVDEFSQEVIVSQIELLLSYVNRFYKRQFITRKRVNNDVLQKTEAILDGYFNTGQTVTQGIQTVQFLSEKLQRLIGVVLLTKTAAIIYVSSSGMY